MYYFRSDYFQDFAEASLQNDELDLQTGQIGLPGPPVLANRRAFRFGLLIHMEETSDLTDWTEKTDSDNACT